MANLVKPTALKIAHGTVQKCRTLKNEMRPRIENNIPVAPDTLKERGKEQWYKLCSELIGLQMLHTVDIFLIETLCKEIDKYFEYEAHLDLYGPVIKIEKTGYQMPSPYASLSNKALKNIQTLSAQFGLTPAARTKITMPEQQAENPFDKFSQ